MHPILVELGSFKIYTFGLFVAMGVLVSFWIGQRSAQRCQITAEMASDLFLCIVLFGVAGARLLYVMEHPVEYFASPWKALDLSEGGLSWFGALVTATASGFFLARVRGVPFFRCADFMAPLIAVGHAIGRIGCFFNGCCIGSVTVSGWGVIYPGETAARCPAPLVESAALLFLAAALFHWSADRLRPCGLLFSRYLACYGTLRFFIEYLRETRQTFCGLSEAQWISLGLLFAGTALHVFIKKRGE